MSSALVTEKLFRAFDKATLKACVIHKGLREESLPFRWSIKLLISKLFDLYLRIQLESVQGVGGNLSLINSEIVAIVLVKLF